MARGEPVTHNHVLLLNYFHMFKCLSKMFFFIVVPSLLLLCNELSGVMVLKMIMTMKRRPP